jgi:hypothetical protein
MTTVHDKLKTYTPQGLVDAAETTRLFIDNPTTSPGERVTFKQLLRAIEDEMRRRVTP